MGPSSGHDPHSLFAATCGFLHCSGVDRMAAVELKPLYGGGGGGDAAFRGRTQPGECELAGRQVQEPKSTNPKIPPTTLYESLVRPCVTLKGNR